MTEYPRQRFITLITADFKRAYAVLEPAIRASKEAKPERPPQQETVLPDGSLTEQRRAELAALSSRVCDVALGGATG
jgi:hypothetical protein